MPNILYTYILNIIDFIWFGSMAYQPLLIVWCQILFYAYILNIYDLVWFGFFSISSIIIIIMSCRKHGYPWPSLATSPYGSSPLAGLQDYFPYPHIAAVCMFEVVVLLFARPYVGVYRSTSLMNSSLLLQQGLACLVRLTWTVFVMGGRWS